MNKYVVIQMQVDNKSINGLEEKIQMSNIVRIVEADSKELAIGKFVVGTKDIKASQKLEIDCYDINELKSL